jgi:acyl-CoA thioesterase-2
MAENGSWSRPLEEFLVVESAGEDRFTARLDGFGGVILGCATLAAARTCPERALHSLHAYFVRPVPGDRPVEIVVERLRDGRRFALRRAQIRLEGRLLFELMASFATAGEGVDYQDAVLDPELPPPESLPSEEEIARAEGWKADEPGPLWGALEWRWIGGTPWQAPAAGTSSRYRAWVRPRFPLPADRPLQAAALAFLSDYHSHISVARKLGGHFDTSGFASLDQVLWVHRDLRWNDWWLLTTESDIGHGGRALTRRLLHSRDGLLVASMAQEQLIPAATASRPE